MLVLSRKAQEAIVIGDDIRITIIEVRRGVVRLGVEAPREVPVMRSELLPDHRQPVNVPEAA